MGHTPDDIYRHVIDLLILIHHEYVAAEKVSAVRQHQSLDLNSEGLQLRRYLSASMKRPIPDWSLDVDVDNQLLSGLHAKLTDAIAKLSPMIDQLVPLVADAYVGVSPSRKYPLHGRCFLESAWSAVQQWAMLIDPSRKYHLRHDTLPRGDLAELADGLTVESVRIAGITVKGDEPCDVLGEAWGDLTPTEQELLNTMYELQDPHGFPFAAVVPLMAWDSLRDPRSAFDKTCSAIRKKLKARSVELPWKMNGRGLIHWLGKK